MGWRAIFHRRRVVCILYNSQLYPPRPNTAMATDSFHTLSLCAAHLIDESSLLKSFFFSFTGSPCEHDGVCVNTPGSFACNCPQGFTGPRCETNVNECDSHPCKNEGSCLDDPGTFRCVCMPGKYIYTLITFSYCEIFQRYIYRYTLLSTFYAHIFLCPYTSHRSADFLMYTAAVLSYQKVVWPW